MRVVILGAVLTGCGPVAADLTTTDGGLQEIDAFEGANESDAPAERTTMPSGQQVPWVGAPAPGVAGEVNTVIVSQVVPGHTVHLLKGPKGGVFNVPGCGFSLDIKSPELLGMVNGDNNGLATFVFDVDLSDADAALVLQAVDLTDCVASAEARVTFADPFGGTTGGTPTTGGTTTTPGTTGTIPAPGDPEVCYPGDRGAYDVCVTLEPAGTQGSDYIYPGSTSANYADPTHFLRLSDIPGSVKISPNFARDELAEEFKGEWGIIQVHALERLQDMRDQIGPIVVSSGYRNPDYNAGVGGASLSRHQYGDGFDLQPSNVSLSTMESTCYSNGAGFVSVYVAHVHCDWRNDSQEPEFYGSAGGPPPPMPQRTMPSAAIERGLGGVLSAPTEGFDCGEPLREWVAYDADGFIIAEATGASFEAPDDAIEVEVTVGRVTTTRLFLP